MIVAVWNRNQLAKVLVPVVTAFLMPLTVTVAPFIPFPSASFTTPFTPRWTCPPTRDPPEFLSVPVTRSCHAHARHTGPPGTHGLHEREQSFLVPLPLGVELLLCWELVTAQLHGDLQAVRVQVVEV